MEINTFDKSNIFIITNKSLKLTKKTTDIKYVTYTSVMIQLRKIGIDIDVYFKIT